MDQQIWVALSNGDSTHKRNQVPVRAKELSLVQVHYLYCVYFNSIVNKLDFDRGKREIYLLNLIMYITNSIINVY